MELKGEFGYLKLEVLTNKGSGTKDFWEENWLYTLVEGRFPGFLVNYKCDLRTDEFKRTGEEILKLLNGETDTANFTTLEEDVEIHFHREDYGEITVDGKLVATQLTNCCLKFNFVIDIFMMKSFSFQVQEILKDYPIIGEM